MGWFALAGAALGTGLQISGQQRSANAAQALSDYRGQIALGNRRIARSNAQSILADAEQSVENKRLETSGRIGSARARAAARGVDVGSGSILDIIGNLAAVGEQDVGTIRSNARGAATNQLQRANEFGSEAALQQLAGQNAIDTGNLNTASSLATGATSVSSKWYEIYGGQ